jgi:hypothetical protein
MANSMSLQDDARPGEAHHVITPDVIAALDGHIGQTNGSLWKWKSFDGNKSRFRRRHFDKTPATAKSACSGFHINSQRNRRLREWLHHCG